MGAVIVARCSRHRLNEKEVGGGGQNGTPKCEADAVRGDDSDVHIETRDMPGSNLLRVRCWLCPGASPTGHLVGIREHEQRIKQITLEEAGARGLNGDAPPIFLSSELYPQRRDLPRLNSTLIEAYAAEPSRGTLRANKAIVTVPTSLLANENIRFDPPLPAKVDADFLLVQEDDIGAVEEKLTGNYYTDTLRIRSFQEPSKAYFRAKIFKPLFPNRAPDLFPKKSG